MTLPSLYRPELAGQLVSIDRLRKKLHKCVDFPEIETWLTDHAQELSKIFRCDAPKAVSINDIKSGQLFPTVDHLWCFYMWIDVNSDAFVHTVMPCLGFNIHWTHYNNKHHGVDSYLSMPKSEWPYMQICEKLNA